MSFVTSAHCPEILAVLTSTGVATLFKYSQSASATHHSTSSEVRCGYKSVGLFFNYQRSMWYMCYMCVSRAIQQTVFTMNGATCLSDRRGIPLYCNYCNYIIIINYTRIAVPSGLGSAVGIATGYGLGGGSNPGGGEIFRTYSDRPWGPHSVLYNGYWVFPWGKERPGRGADPSPPFSAVGMKE